MKISEFYTYAPKSKIKAGDANPEGCYQFFASSPDKHRRCDEAIYDSSAIIMGTGGGATIHYYDGKFSTSTDCLVLIPKDNINPKYLYYVFLGNLDYLKSGFHGAGLQHTSKGHIDNLEINNIPSLQTQEKIVELFNKLERVILNKQEQLSRLDDLVKARFVEMFGNENGDISFNDVLVDNTKNGFKLDSSYYTKDGEVAIVDQGQKLICGYTEARSEKEPWVDKAIIFGDHTEVVKYIDFPFYLGADGTKLLSPKDGWNTRFLYHYLDINYHKRLGYMRHFKYLKEMTFIKPDIKRQNDFAVFCEQVDKSKFAISTTQYIYDEILLRSSDSLWHSA